MRPGYVFVSTDTDTVEELNAACYVIDVETLTNEDSETLADCDAFGTFSETAHGIIRRVGIPVRELIAAWQWRETLRAADILADIETQVMLALGDDPRADRVS